MAGSKETPRQKMIGMMYLVLTALLALNVSKDILDAFILINESLEITNENFAKKNDLTYNVFEQQLALAPEKVRPYYEKAMKAKQYANDLINYVNERKYEMISFCEGIPLEQAKTITLKEIQAKDNYDKPTTYWVGSSPDGSEGKARELKQKIEEFKANMMALLDESQREAINLGLVTEGTFESGGQQKNWEMYNFYYLVQAAQVTNLNKIITEIRNAEFDVISALYTGISAADFKFDKISAKVVPNSQVVMVGDNFEAQIFVAAYDTKDNPEIVVGDAIDTLTLRISGNEQQVEAIDGVGLLKIPASSEGRKTYGGVIKVVSPDGTVVPYPFQGEYFVQRPSATVAPTKMNVFYIGVDNPVSVSVPGIPPEQVSVSMTGGTIRASRGQDPTGSWTHIVRPDAGAREAIIRVSANIESGSRSMGQAAFRVRRVPDPVAYIANTREGNVSSAALIAAGGLIPRLDNFEFDMNFTISSFTFLMSVPGGDIQEARSSSNRLTPEMTQMLQRARRGQRVWFENITARGPDGSTRQLSAIALRIQ
ncbi:MAG: gliding motility protein GldM [Bacteroidales bacterium]|nr:gliding motility protein GldM [Bacteroidales bacterium]